MGSHQQYCLKWNNYHSNLSSEFKSLLTQSSFVDVTLACEGQSIKAHKVLLSACSPFFHELFLQNPCTHPIVILKDILFADIKAILEYIYHGEVNVTHDKLASFLKTAQILKVKGLDTVNDENEDGNASDAPEESTEGGTSSKDNSQIKNGHRKRKRRSSNSHKKEDSSDKSLDAPPPQTKQSPKHLEEPDIEELTDSSSYNIMPQIESPPDTHQDASNQSFGFPSHMPQSSALPSISNDPISEDQSYSMGTPTPSIILPDNTMNDDDDCIMEHEVKPELPLEPPEQRLPLVAEPSALSLPSSSGVETSALDQSTSFSPSSQIGGGHFECPVCYRSLSNKYSLKLHMELHQQIRRRYACNFCSRTYSQLSHLIRHKKSHPGPTPYLLCSTCNQPFIYQAALERHMRIKHH